MLLHLSRHARLRNPANDRHGRGSESIRIILYWNSLKTITPVGVPMNTFPLAIIGVMFADMLGAVPGYAKVSAVFEIGVPTSFAFTIENAFKESPTAPK